jgi:hypothetical protein
MHRLWRRSFERGDTAAGCPGLLAPLLSLERTYHTVSPDEAHAIITDLVTREVAVIEEIDGQPVCSKDLSVGDQILVFLYPGRP